MGLPDDGPVTRTQFAPPWKRRTPEKVSGPFAPGRFSTSSWNPKAFAPVIKRAKAAGVILVAFDNILDTEEAINVDVDQKGLGVLWANWLIKHLPSGGKILEVRGVAGTSVDTDRHNGIHETLGASGKNWDVVEVVGKWDDPTAQKATADAIAVQKHFDGITARGGDTGALSRAGACSWQMVHGRYPLPRTDAEGRRNGRGQRRRHATSARSLRQ